MRNYDPEWSPFTATDLELDRLHAEVNAANAADRQTQINPADLPSDDQLAADYNELEAAGWFEMAH